MAQILDDWGTGQRDLAISGGAAGADILFSELCLERGASLRLLLAMDPERFVRASVRPSGRSWEVRFRHLLEVADTWILPAADIASDTIGTSPYGLNNEWMLEVAAREVDVARIRVLLVWNQDQARDGPGGTADFASAVIAMGATVEVVNPELLDP